MGVTNARWMVNITHEIQYLVFSSVAHKYIWSTLSFMIMVIMIIISMSVVVFLAHPYLLLVSIFIFVKQQNVVIEFHLTNEVTFLRVKM